MAKKDKTVFLYLIWGSIKKYGDVGRKSRSNDTGHKC